MRGRGVGVPVELHRATESMSSARAGIIPEECANALD